MAGISDTKEGEVTRDEDPRSAASTHSPFRPSPHLPSQVASLYCPRPLNCSAGSPTARMQTEPMSQRYSGRPAGSRTRQGPGDPSVCLPPWAQKGALLAVS